MVFLAFILAAINYTYIYTYIYGDGKDTIILSVSLPVKVGTELFSISGLLKKITGVITNCYTLSASYFVTRL